METISKKNLAQIERTLSQITDRSVQLEKQFSPLIQQVHPKNKKSALNLLHYVALRSQNIEDIQQQLSSMGVSSLQHAESHVMANIRRVQSLLKQESSSQTEIPSADISFAEGQHIINQNRQMFGPSPDNRSVHIMVTFPSEAAADAQLVEDMVKAGMTCARINCAKDNEQQWAKMIDNIRKAEKTLNKSCKILMDLGGPKIRTGQVRQDGKVVKLQPAYNASGKLIQPATLRFAKKYRKVSQHEAIVPVDKSWLDKAHKGDQVVFKDAQGDTHRLKIESTGKQGVKVLSDNFLFLNDKTSFTLRRHKEDVSHTDIGKIPAAKQRIELQQGDILLIHADQEKGEPAVYDGQGRVKRPAHIGCSMPEVFQYVKPGDPILFDDGKIRGTVAEASSEQLTVEIAFAKNEKRSLKPDKGINLPDSPLDVSGLTDKDLKDLDFVVQHADIVNLSFVRDPKDVNRLLEELEKRQAKDIGIMLKIETQRAVKNLPWLILHAMKHYPVSIMLARGDLAIETGWEEMAVLQDEILWICEAAHVPVVWATQVLEGMAKKGLPKRAEISDAAMAYRADCIMLNKGDYIIETIQMLVDILQKMEKQNMKSSNLVQSLNLEEAVQTL